MVLASASPPVTTATRQPTYAGSDKSRVLSSFASVAAKGADKEGYILVGGHKRLNKKKAAAVPTPDPITDIPARARHLTVKFARSKDTRMSLPDGVTTGFIRESLNNIFFS